MTSDELRAICVANGIVVSLTGLVRERDAAKLLDVAPRTLRDWRSEGIGPRAVRLGGQSRYSLDELVAYLTPADTGSFGRTGRKIDVCAVDETELRRHDAPSLARKARAS